jgi:hypothetical protein
MWTVFIWIGIDSCEHGTETSDSIKDGEFLDHMSDYQLFNKNPAPWNWFNYVHDTGLRYLQAFLMLWTLCYFLHSMISPSVGRSGGRFTEKLWLQNLLKFFDVLV